MSENKQRFSGDIHPIIKVGSDQLLYFGIQHEIGAND